MATLLAGALTVAALVPAHPALAATAPELPPSGQTFEHYPPMKEVYEDYFSFGIFGAGEVEGLVYNYASYTPGNEMKPESTQRDKGVFTFDPAEAAFARYTTRNPDLALYGHTLAWHSQTPTWMWDAPPARFDQPGTFDSAVALENLNTHVEAVLGHFGERLVAIDVVNEAVGTANPADWRGSLAKGEGWYQALGADWVELAFLKAAEVVDANGWDVKLTYNDFGLDSPAKARVVYEMVKDINERHAGLRPGGKPLIEVIGMQGHYNLATDVTAVEQNIKLFATLGDVEVHVTEMDIALPPGELTPENENNQGMKYAELFQVYRDHAAGPANTTDNPHVVAAVKLAGVRDVVTGWKGGEFAMPYDYDGNAKLALLGILYPEQFLATHEYIDTSGGEERPPVPGVHVFDTSAGDSWSGANIVLGDDASAWPWSTTDDGEVAFRPEPGATYRLTVNYTAKGTTAIRVRWLKDNTNGGYTSGDGAVINDHQYSASQVATHIPAYFNSGMVNMGSYDLVTQITLDGDQPADGLIGNIGIRGGAGGNAFSVNTIKVEKVSDAGDEVLVTWPAAAVPPASAPAAPTAVSAVAAAGSATVSWTPPADDGGSPVTVSTVTAAPGGATCTTDGASCVVTGLTNGRAYTFTVVATNAAGASEPSAASAPVTPMVLPGTPGQVSLTVSADAECVAGRPRVTVHVRNNERVPVLVAATTPWWSVSGRLLMPGASFERTWSAPGASVAAGNVRVTGAAVVSWRPALTSYQAGHAGASCG
ncbi:endo-1,4-beta-xylanase [Cellulomonas xiejunii]|uniref:Beta-xylanase n=1 Tax=Cellulomonas xiejunii TaxID=2968083 RepID=A0ABY5KN81_9CELL|nr:endo-1,4-beta-xylanase [Cellulomonas xiejunii]MCC2321154.1 endo-1,4-beta-xylanase [Cellulomonas xiejunii]UUI71744.1 endo-1,4-beta-xylanase [Cellulomonas xiejunii]